MSDISLEPLLNSSTEYIGLDRALRTITKRPTTVVIYNTPTTDANWTAIATGLSGVLAWRMSEAGAQAFDYAFIASPTTYMTAYGAIQRDTEITAIYARRKGANNITLQLEVWTA